MEYLVKKPYEIILDYHFGEFLKFYLKEVCQKKTSLGLHLVRDSVTLKAKGAKSFVYYIADIEECHNNDVESNKDFEIVSIEKIRELNDYIEFAVKENEGFISNYVLEHNVVNFIINENLVLKFQP